MFLRIPQLLNAEQLAEIDAVLAGAGFVDGRLTAGETGRKAKNNRQADPAASPGHEAIGTLVMSALAGNALVRATLLPVKIVPPTFSKYEPGMTYDWHTDYPVMTVGPMVRTDISVTVFLSDPESYVGGELIVRTSAGEAKFKLPRGSAVAYPATTMHRVAEVSSGERLAAITWMQSMIADGDRRELLHDLDTAYRLSAQRAPDGQETRLLLKSYANLVRMWADL